MTGPPEQVRLYHITDIANLPGILEAGGLHSDAAMANRNPTVIGYSHIKERRLKELRVACCGNRFVGEFVPFYFCPRSPMLFTINKGNTGRSPGCQTSILHLVTTIADATGTGREWAISDGNAGAIHTWFGGTLDFLATLDWEAIRATWWQGKTHEKCAEFLVADFFPWRSIREIGCYDKEMAERAVRLIESYGHRPPVQVQRNWYY